jgi:hypothetical protein
LAALAAGESISLPLSLFGDSGLAKPHGYRLFQSAFAAFFLGRFFEGFALGKFADVRADVLRPFSSWHGYTLPTNNVQTTQTKVMT